MKETKYAFSQLNSRYVAHVSSNSKKSCVRSEPNWVRGKKTDIARLLHTAIVELAKAESKPRDLSKNSHQRSAHLGASGNLVLTGLHSISLGIF
jgi:hypothetical protein